MNMFEAVIRSDRGRWVWSIEATESGRTVEDSTDSYVTVEAICTPVKAALARWNDKAHERSVLLGVASHQHPAQPVS